MSRFRWPSTEDELRAAGFYVGLFIIAFWAGSGVSPNPQVVGLVAILIGQKILPSRKARDSNANGDKSGDQPVEVVRSSNGDVSPVDRSRDRGSGSPWVGRLQQRPCG